MVWVHRTCCTDGMGNRCPALLELHAEHSLSGQLASLCRCWSHKLQNVHSRAECPTMLQRGQVRLGHALLFRTLCVPPCKSCFIRDIDLCGGVWQLPAAPQMRICAHARARNACNARKAAIGPQRSLSRIKHDLHRTHKVRNPRRSRRVPAAPSGSPDAHIYP